MNLRVTTAVILCGGLGTRLRSVLPDQQKTIAPVNGKPFIQFLLDQVVDYGCSQIVLCAGYKAGQLQSSLGSQYRCVPLIYSIEDRPLGTGGALRQALPLFSHFPILVLNGDSYTDVNLNEYIDWHNEQNAPASMVLTVVSETGRFGSVKVNGSRIIAFEEKKAEIVTESSNLINAGVYLLSRQHIESIPADAVTSLERQCFPEWIDTGFYAFATTAQFLDIGVPDSYLSAGSFFKAYEAETTDFSGS